MHFDTKTLLGVFIINNHSQANHWSYWQCTWPFVGHMHPPFFKIMDDIQEGLRYVFQTSSKYTLLISSSGHGGACMHACRPARASSLVELPLRCLQCSWTLQLCLLQVERSWVWGWRILQQLCMRALLQAWKRALQTCWSQGRR